MLLKKLYPGYLVLEKICFLPLSRNYYPEEFYNLLCNGLDHAIKTGSFIQSEKMRFETSILAHSNLIDAHVEFFDENNFYWLCKENIEGVNYVLNVVTLNNTVIWVYLSK